MGDWRVYIVRCADGTLYTGIATDLAARIACHNSGKGAKYVRSRLPVEPVWSEKAKTRSEAQRREAEIKRWPKAKKERLVSAGRPGSKSIVPRLGRRLR